MRGKLGGNQSVSSLGLSSARGVVVDFESARVKAETLEDNEGDMSREQI